MPFSQVLQLDVPDLFPLKSFEVFVAAAKGVVQSKTLARREFNEASNLIGWRFRAYVEYKDAFLESWRQKPKGENFEDIYERERVLFGMFVSGVSAVEATCYACYALASDPAVLGLPFDEKVRRYQSGPKHLYSVLSTVLVGRPITAALKTLVESDEWALMTAFRNTMTHRSNIPRINYAAVGSEPPPALPFEFAATWSSKALRGDEQSVEELAVWLAATVTSLCDGGADLATGPSSAGVRTTAR